MPKDFNGKEIKVGDVVKHRFEAHPRDNYYSWAERMRRENPDNLKYDGFFGEATVTHVGTSTAELDSPALRGRIPVFASGLLIVQ